MSSVSKTNETIFPANGERTLRAISGYVNYRYSCELCGAKFKSFKTYLTHCTSHQSMGSRYLSPGLEDTRMNALLGAGEQCIKEYFDSEYGYAEYGYGGNFICDECKTVFLHRDAYAMHMMMRAMNKTCKPVGNEIQSNNNVGESSSMVTGTSSLHSDAEDLSVRHETYDTSQQQRCLEDVTSSVGQDEYLKSVLENVCFPASDKRNVAAAFIADNKMCSFCGGVFSDQDTLAMHVMSNHADAMKYSGRSHAHSTPSSAIIHNTAASSNISWLATIKSIAMEHVCSYCNETFQARDSLAMHVLTHTHFDAKLIEPSRNSYKRNFPTSHVDNALAGKKSRYSTAPNGAVHEKSDEAANGNLFCKLCDITFYASTEYKWHMDKHKEGSLPTYNNCNNNRKRQPDIHIAVFAPENGPRELTTADAAMRLRRNSASFLTRQKSKESDALPQRSVSVGAISAKTLQSLHPEHSKTMHKHFGSTPDSEHEGNTAVDTKTVFSKVRALSTNEQRIIYSVFGKDLGLKLPVNQPKEQQDPNVEDSEVEPARSLDKPCPPENESAIGAPEISSDSKPPTIDKGKKIRLPDLKDVSNAPMCTYCDIVFFNKAIYLLHMGLHSVNNHWQCNVCGKVCTDAVDFAAHVIHM